MFYKPIAIASRAALSTALTAKSGLEIFVDTVAVVSEKIQYHDNRIWGKDQTDPTVVGAEAIEKDTKAFFGAFADTGSLVLSHMYCFRYGWDTEFLFEKCMPAAEYAELTLLIKRRWDADGVPVDTYEKAETDLVLAKTRYRMTGNERSKKVEAGWTNQAMYYL